MYHLLSKENQWLELMEAEAEFKVINKRTQLLQRRSDTAVRVRVAIGREHEG
jgi:hypothetical protein